MDSTAVVSALVLTGVLVVAALVGVWIAALLDVIRAQDIDDTARLLLGLLLIFFAPVGLVIWVVLRRSTWRTGLVVTLGLGLGLTVAVAATVVLSRAPRPVVIVSGQAGGAMSVPAAPPATAP